jgi:hypothetical protein
VRLRRPATSRLRANRASRVLGPDKVSPCGAGSVGEQQPPNTSPAPLPSDQQPRNKLPAAPSSASGQGSIITSTSAAPKTFATGRSGVAPDFCQLAFAFWVVCE